MLLHHPPGHCRAASVTDASGNVRYQLNTPYLDGTTHYIFEPLDFIARLAALIPRLWVNLTCYYVCLQ